MSPHDTHYNVRENAVMPNAKGGADSHSVPADNMEAVGEVILHRYDQGFHETCVSSAISNARPRCKCVHLYLYNLKPETFFSPLIISRRKEQTRFNLRRGSGS